MTEFTKWDVVLTDADMVLLAEGVSSSTICPDHIVFVQGEI